MNSALDLSIGKRRIQKLTIDALRFVFCKVKKEPILTQKHNTARLEWAHLHHNKFSQEWGLIVCCDGIQPNVDGLDWFSNYWHDMSISKVVISNRRIADWGMIVWGCFSVNGFLIWLLYKEIKDFKSTVLHWRAIYFLILMKRCLWGGFLWSRMHPYKSKTCHRSGCRAT